MSDPLRSRQARQLAEAALRRIVVAYGDVPRFVLLGGLVPDLLCTGAAIEHAGTTDVDVQVDIEIAGGSPNAARLEAALRSAGFVPDRQRAWRWEDHDAPGMVVKAEFLADLDDVPDHTTVTFDGCEQLGAINLRGTGFAARDWRELQLPIATGKAGESVILRVTGIAGYLLAKTHAAYGRRATKDWYDVAYVLIHNDLGGPTAAALQVRQRFPSDLIGQTRTAVDDLATNFADSSAQGPEAYATTMLSIRPELDWDATVNDAVAAVGKFVSGLDLSE